jgi:hypothetical protein
MIPFVIFKSDAKKLTPSFKILKEKFKDKLFITFSKKG